LNDDLVRECYTCLSGIELEIVSLMSKMLLLPDSLFCRNMSIGKVGKWIELVFIIEQSIYLPQGRYY